MDSESVDKIFKDLELTTKFDKDSSKQCNFLSEAIINKEITIHKIVENLGSLLVDPLVQKREKGTLILSCILENLPSDFLTSTELHFIASFYSDRLKDHHQVIPAVLNGILAITKMNNLPEGAPHKLLNALFENVPCQQQQLKDRQTIYQIFKEFLNRRSTEIIAMGLDFVLGVIQAMDGERDPRNLLLLFNWLPKFLTTIKLGHLNEEMFEVIACYFPVDFRTPTQEAQNNLKREDLANALCPCLCAIPEFAEFCIPLIIDKLNSSLKIAKYDSLNLLTDSCKTFNVSIYEQHSHDLWNLLQKESLNSNDTEIEEACLNAISAIINLLSTSNNPEIFQQTVDNLYDTLKGNLKPDTKLFLPSSKILLAVGRASNESCNKIVQPIVALLLNQFNLTRDINQREILFRTLIEFAVAYLKLFETNNISEINVLNEIPPLCLESMLIHGSEIKVIGYESISRIAKVLPLAFRQKLYSVFKEEIIRKSNENVRNSFLKTFKTFANLYQNEIVENFMSSNLEIDVTSDLIILQLYLEALIVVLSEKTYVELVLPKILNYCVHDDIQIAKIAIESLRKLLEEHHNNKFIQEYLYFNCKCLEKTTNWILTKIETVDYEILKDISTINKIMIGYQNVEIQNLILNSNINQLLNIYKSNEILKDKIIILLEGFLIRLRPEVVISHKFELIKELLQVSSTIEESSYTYACIIIANVINKSSEDESFINLLNEIEIYIDNKLKDCPNEMHLKNLIQLISWLTKSLIIKGSNRAEIWTNKLISLLDVYEETAKSFQLIMDDSHDCLSTKSYCTNRLLYRQKFFAYVCKKLSNTYNENTPSHLMGLGYLLQLAPLKVIILYFKEILRLLKFCLELCKDPDVLCAVLNTLCILIKNKEPYLEDHIDDLLPRFLKLTTFELSMKVRISALQCIQEFPDNYPVYKLLPHKRNIIFGLTNALDDKKRLVRKQAVEARSRWFLLDAPT